MGMHQQRYLSQMSIIYYINSQTSTDILQKSAADFDAQTPDN